MHLLLPEYVQLVLIAALLIVTLVYREPAKRFLDRMYKLRVQRGKTKVEIEMETKR